MTSLPSADDSSPSKAASATCPAGKRLIGGGARVDDHGSGKVALTMLWPLRNNEQPDRYDVAASALTGFTGKWLLQAYALCAAPLPGLELSWRSTGSFSAQKFQHAEAPCPAGKRVTGAGGLIAFAPGQNNPSGHVGLQLSRASGPLDIARTTARADDYNGTWELLSFALCANNVAGAQVASKIVTALSGGSVDCPAGTSVQGAGGGGSITDSGPVYLQSAYPVSLRRVQTRMTAAPADGMVVQAVCAP
jgi:hypothetical protein